MPLVESEGPLSDAVFLAAVGKGLWWRDDEVNSD